MQNSFAHSLRSSVPRFAAASRVLRSNSPLTDGQAQGGELKPQPKPFKTRQSMNIIDTLHRAQAVVSTVAKNQSLLVEFKTAGEIHKQNQVRAEHIGREINELKYWAASVKPLANFW